MSIHLFSTPVQCTNCGTIVDDPTVDKCPNCQHLLKERRTPARLAGVERKYGNIRLLTGFLRFLGVGTVLIGVMLFVFSDGNTPITMRILSGMGAMVIAVTMFVVASLFEVALDIEENTRATFRMQQMIQEGMHGDRPRQP